MKPTRSPIGRLALTCILISASACVDEFPATTSVVPISVDARVQVDADLTDARSPDLDGTMPPSDAGPPIDQGALDMAPDIFVDPSACRIGAPVRELTLRTWNAASATRVLDLDTDCEAIEFDAPAWLQVRLDGRRLRIEAPPARGVTDGVVTLTADGRTVSIDVRRIGLEEGGDRRRALIYVVDGLKGDTLEQSAPEAIEWLIKNATSAYDAVPHMPVEGATRASGWGSLLTGLAPAAHGFDGAGAIGVPTFTDRLGGKVFAAVEWDVIAAGLGVAPLSRRDVISRTISAFDSDASLFVMGVNGLLNADLDELVPRRAQIDADLDALLAGIADRPADEDWLIVLAAATSDGRGPPDLPVLYAAPGLTARDPGDVTLMDVHTSVLGWLRVLRPGWDLPGEQLTGGVEIDCGDGADNDRDGRIDCRDADCLDVCPLGCVDEDISARIGRNVVSRSMVGIANKRAGCTGVASAPDLVVSWVAPKSSVYMLSTEGSNFDTMLDPLAQHCAGTQLAAECVDSPVGICGLANPPNADDPLWCYDDPYRIDGPEPAAFGGTFAEGDVTQIFLTGFSPQNPADNVRLNIVDVLDACRTAPLLDLEYRGDNSENLLTLQPFLRTGDKAEACKRATGNALIRWQAPVGNWRIELDADFAGASIALWEGGCEALAPLFCETDALGVRVPIASEVLLVVSSSWAPGQIERGTFRIAVTPFE